MVISRKPTALFRGHSAPIFFLHVAEDDNRVYSMSTERIIKVLERCRVCVCVRMFLTVIVNFLLSLARHKDGARLSRQVLDLPSLI